MHFGVQRLDTAVEHLGEIRDLGYFGDRQLGFGQQFGRTAGRDEFDAQGMQGSGEFDNTGFVRDGDQGIHSENRVEVFGS